MLAAEDTFLACLYEEKGEVKDDGREEKRLSHVYSEEQVHAAVSFYTEHGKSLSKTAGAIGKETP